MIISYVGLYILFEEPLYMPLPVLRSMQRVPSFTSLEQSLKCTPRQVFTEGKHILDMRNLWLLSEVGLGLRGVSNFVLSYRSVDHYSDHFQLDLSP